LKFLIMNMMIQWRIKWSQSIYSVWKKWVSSLLFLLLMIGDVYIIYSLFLIYVYLFLRFLLMYGALFFSLSICERCSIYILILKIKIIIVSTLSTLISRTFTTC
jgi:hypothetical protein